MEVQVTPGRSQVRSLCGGLSIATANHAFAMHFAFPMELYVSGAVSAVLTHWTPPIDERAVQDLVTRNSP